MKLALCSCFQHVWCTFKRGPDRRTWGVKWRKLSDSLLENGRLSDRSRIRTDTGCIVSNRIWLLLYQPILRASLQVQQLLTCPITQQIKGHSLPSPAACARHLIHDTGEGWRGGRRETVTWYPPPCDTKTAQYWVLATSDRWRCTPSTSRKW